MRIGLGGYLWRYAFYVIVVQLAVYGLLWALEYFAPELAAGFYGSGASTGLNVASVMLPGIYVGQKWARTEHRPMPNGFGWVMALSCTMLLSVASILVAGWLIRTDHAVAIIWADLSHNPGLVWIVIAVSIVMILGLTRLSIWLAVRGELKRQVRLAARS